jgi:hypothetical protein
MCFRPFPVPLQTLLIHDTRSNFDIHPAQNLLNRNFDPVFVSPLPLPTTPQKSIKLTSSHSP